MDHFFKVDHSMRMGHFYILPTGDSANFTHGFFGAGLLWGPIHLLRITRQHRSMKIWIWWIWISRMDDPVDYNIWMTAQTGSIDPWDQPLVVHLDKLIQLGVFYSSNHKWLVLEWPLKNRCSVFYMVTVSKNSIDSYVHTGTK